MKTKPMMRIIPKSPIPITFIITIATSQVTFNSSAKPARTHLDGSSEPSSGIFPDNQTKAETFKSKVPPIMSCFSSETFGLKLPTTRVSLSMNCKILITEYLDDPSKNLILPDTCRNRSERFAIPSWKTFSNDCRFDKNLIFFLT